MSSINPAIAIQSYQQMMGLGTVSDMGATTVAPSFQETLKKTFNQTVEAVHQHENIAIQHTIGEDSVRNSGVKTQEEYREI